MEAASNLNLETERPYKRGAVSTSLFKGSTRPSPERDTRKVRHRAAAKKYCDTNRDKINARAWARQDRWDSSNYTVIVLY